MAEAELSSEQLAQLIEAVREKLTLTDAQLHELRIGPNEIELAGRIITVWLMSSVEAATRLEELAEAETDSGPAETYVGLWDPTHGPSPDVAPAVPLLQVARVSGLQGFPRIPATTTCWECTNPDKTHHFEPKDVTPDGSGQRVCKHDHSLLVAKNPCTRP
jgi:hypothetical protein